ncbi:MAG TPA: PAS domain S-box protein [bacterium]|nr:PAS domain S-box protein [bacterium]
MPPRSRDPRREAEEQAAFEDAERSRAELRAGAAFDGFVDSSPVGIELFSPAGKPLRSNKAAERLLGKVPPPGIALFDERGLKRAGLLEPQLRRVLAGARVETPPTWYDPTEIGLPGIPGRKICFRATVFPMLDSEGQVTRIAVMYEELTELKKLEQEVKENGMRLAAAPAAYEAAPPPGADARDIEFQRRKLETALRESEERYRSLVESAHGYVVVRFAEEGRILAISPAVENFWGIKRDTIFVDNPAFFSRIHPDDIEQVKSTEASARKTGAYPDDYKFRVVHMTTGAVYWLAVRGSVSTYAGKRVFDELLIDITESRRVEDTLRERERNISAIVTSYSDGVFTMDNEWIVRDWSPGAEKETRIATSEAIGKRLWEVYPDIEKSGFGPIFRKVLLEHVSEHHEGFYQDGREKYAGWFAVSVYPYGAGVLAMIRNVSQRKRAELAWRDAEAKLNAMMAVPDLIVTLKDHNLRYTMASPGAMKMMGANAGDSVIGKTDLEIYSSKVSSLIVSQDRQVLERAQSAELEIALPDGAGPNAAWYHISKQPWLGPGGTVIGILDVAFDVTTRVRAQQELLRRREFFEKTLHEQEQTLSRARDELSRWTK